MRCLIIEDEKPLAIATAEALKEHGWVVDLAHDGRTGLSMGMQSDYDVICIDIMLPALNGYDVLKHLRAGEVWTPVLMLTAKDGEYDQTDAFELAVGDLILNPATHRVYRGSDEITLTAREFALLQHFMRHPEVVLSKTTLLEEVWDSNYPGADNVVEVYVGYLRKKIDAPFDVISLETVRGRGYRLVPVSSSGPTT